MRIKKVLVAITIAASALGFSATEAGAYPADGTVITVGNRAIPGTSYSVSCWAQYFSTAVVVNCYRYDQWSNPLSHDQYNLPKEYCNYAAWNGSTPQLQVSNTYFYDSPSYPDSSMSGDAPGCGLGYNQSGSQAWARNYITPNPCGIAGQPSCTTNLGSLAGGSYWYSPGVSRSQSCGYAGINCRYGYGIYSKITYTQ